MTQTYENTHKIRTLNGVVLSFHLFYSFDYRLSSAWFWIAIKPEPAVYIVWHFYQSLSVTPIIETQKCWRHFMNVKCERNELLLYIYFTFFFFSSFLFTLTFYSVQLQLHILWVCWRFACLAIQIEIVVVHSLPL